MSPVKRDAKEEAYDVVVVGSGMGGLSVGAVLAFCGKSVLVVERHDRPGGYCHGFQRGRYRFDAAIHASGGCVKSPSGRPALIHNLLEIFGLAETLSFLPIDPIYSARYPGLTFDAPSGIPEFVAAHTEHFPTEQKGLKELFRLCIKVNQERDELPPDVSSYEAVKQPDRFPLLFQYRDATFAEVLDQYLSVPQLKTIIASLWPYQGLPPSRMSFLHWAPMMISFVQGGLSYCQGGFQKLADAFVQALEAKGGELLLRTRVRRILTNDGRVSGVMLEDGQRIAAPIVVSNADAIQTFEELVGAEMLPEGFLPGLRRMTPSLSAISIYVATSLDLVAAGVGHQNFLYSTWDHDESYGDLVNGNLSSLMLSAPTLLDASLAPAGEHTLSIVALIPYGIASSWRQDKDRLVGHLLERVEQTLPGLREKTSLMEGASPRTMERYTLNHLGAMYGWEPSPAQTVANRLGHRTPVEGLYLSGHWTQPGGGLLPVALSGVQTAQLILGSPSVPELLRSMQ